jgi:hypothetical protein
LLSYQPSRVETASVQLFELDSESVHDGAQSAPSATANAARTRTATNTPWTLRRHVIPDIPLCFSNYARSDSKYAANPADLSILR